FRGHNQLQQTTHAHGTHLAFFRGIEMQFAAIPSVAQQRLACLIANSQCPHEVQTVIHQRLWSERGTKRAQALDYGLHTWLGDIRKLIHGKVDALVQSAPINPLLTRVPAFYRWWIE